MAYPVETWAKVKSDYETGNYSYDKLSEIYQISVPAIRLKADEENWEKGKLKPKIEEKTQNRVINMLSKLGWDEEKRIKSFSEILEANKTVNIGGCPVTDPDWSARARAHDMLFKLTGDYAPEKQEISGLLGVKKEYDLSKLTSDELEIYLALQKKIEA